MLIVLCFYLNGKCVKNGGSRRRVLGGCLGFLTGDMEERVTHDGKVVLCGPQGSYPEGFVSLSLFLVEI